MNNEASLRNDRFSFSLALYQINSRIA